MKSVNQLSTFRADIVCQLIKECYAGLDYIIVQCVLRTVRGSNFWLTDRYLNYLV